MSAFVLDNSVTMRWCFENEATPYSEGILEHLLAGDEARVPVLWIYEVVAVLAKAQRTASITAMQAHEFLEDLRSLDIIVDEQDFGHIYVNVHRLAVEQKLSGYDAAYLELARRKGLPLASLDDDLNKAARAVGVHLSNPSRRYATAAIGSRDYARFNSGEPAGALQAHGSL